MIYFSSDHHFNHRNIIKYSNRPFSCVEEMNEIMLERWNKTIKPSDTVYYLGDLSFGDFNYTEKLIKSLNGTIFYLFGNHDRLIKKEWKLKSLFKWTGDYLELSYNKEFIVMSHYCFEIWNRHHHGSYHCYGHSHGNYKDASGRKRIDVGVDCWNFYPVSFEQLKEEMDKKIINKIDFIEK
jgi:calcineurin-like phosphoesterase family protein